MTFCNFVCLVAVGPARSKWVTTNDLKFELYGTVCLDGFTLGLFGLDTIWREVVLWTALCYVMCGHCSDSDSAISAPPRLPFAIHYICKTPPNVTALFPPSWAGLRWDGPRNWYFKVTIGYIFKTKLLFLVYFQTLFEKIIQSTK